MKELQTLIARWLPVDGALSYSFEELKKSRGYISDITEEKAIARALCGVNDHLAYTFMEGGDVEGFEHNVSFNGNGSAPLIMRAIQIRLQNQK